MFKRFAIHLGGGLFLANLVTDVETVAKDAEIIAADAMPIALEVTSLAGAFTSKDPIQLIEHVAKLSKLLPQFVAEVHELVSIPYVPETVTTSGTNEAAIKAAVTDTPQRISFSPALVEATKH